MIWSEPDRYYAPAVDAYWDQGDVVVAPVTALDAESEDADTGAVGIWAPVRRTFWSADDDRSTTTGETLLGLAMIVSHGCSLDKEFNRRFEDLRRRGYTLEAAEAEAAADDSLDRLVTVAPVIPLADVGRADAGVLRANRVVGYFPMCDSEDRSIDEGVVDLSRGATIDRGVIVARLGILSDDARATLLYALARYWAFRAPKLTYDVEEAIGRRIIHADVISSGELSVILELDDGSSLRLFQVPVDPTGGPERPGLPQAS